MGIFNIFKNKKSENINLKVDNNSEISFGNGCVVSKKVFDEIEHDSDIERYLNAPNESEFINYVYLL